MWDILEKVAIVLATAALTVIFSFMIYVMLIWMPVSLYAEAECLKQGYPEAIVSIGLERYCTTLDGMVTTRVDKQGE